MTELEERARRVLEAARTGHGPSAADRARVRAGLRARVLAEPMLIEPGLPAPRPSLLGTKLMLVFAAGGCAGFAAGFAVAQAIAGAPASAPQAPASVAVVAASTAVENTVSVGETSQRAPAANELAEPAADDKPVTLAPRAKPRASESRRNEHVAADGVGSASALKAELDGLRRAQELLYRGDAAWALARLDELDRAQGSALLLEERMATRVIAECVVGKGSAARVREFANKFPNSAHLERVRASCAGTNGNQRLVSPVPSGRATTERD